MIYLDTLMLDVKYTNNEWNYAKYFITNNHMAPLITNTSYVRIGLYAIASQNGSNDTEIRFDDMFFGVVDNETENNPPAAPTISGQKSGKTGENYAYTFTSTDLDGDDLYYWIQWEDGCPNVEWIGPYKSGEPVVLNHSWETRGTYEIKATVRDTHNATSDWATLEVSMPKSYGSHNIIYHMLERLVDWFVDTLTALKQN